MFKSTSVVKTFLFVILLSVAASCSKYNRVLKSTDLEYKYEMAVKYYDKGDWVKAEAIFQELIGLYRGMSKAEIIYYYYAYCNYYIEDYVMAGYYFKNFIKTYPTSEHAEECMFMSAYCNYLDSPGSSLDQTNSIRAIEMMQLYINRYPESDRIEEANGLIDELRDKLETKAYDIALLYFKIGSYKASIVSFGNVLIDFPDTKFREASFFYILKSNFLLSENSIDSKKNERYQATIKAFYEYERFIPKESVDGENEGETPGASFAKEAASMLKTAKQEIESLKNIN